MELPKRKKTRLEGYDYSSNGAYFVTICTYNREQILGDINVGQGLCSCRLSHIGRIVQDEIQKITNRYVGVKIDKYVIMPNHIHLIILLERQEQSPCPTIGDIICVIKSISTKNANKIEHKSGRKIWQRSFHDHIIRGEREYQKIWEYIDTNPLKWEEDCFYNVQNKAVVQ
ncbi:MAG: transposase [Oscillospiraceae bacterium]